MDEEQYRDLAAWIVEAGLEGRNETALLEGFCERASAYGLPLTRVSIIIDTLHPIYEGRVFRWHRDEEVLGPIEYLRSEEVEWQQQWRRSPFYHLLQGGESLLRRRLSEESESEFSVFPELRAAGFTDYVARSIGSLTKAESATWKASIPRG